MNNYIRPKIRSFSASRQRRQTNRRSSLNTDPIEVIPYHTVSPGNTVILPCVDLRTIPQKIEDLQKEMRECAVNEIYSYLMFFFHRHFLRYSLNKI